MLLGKIPAVFLPFLFGANLAALHKPDGGLHSIAVGSVFRSLTSKAAYFSLSVDLGQFLCHVQLGFGTPGVCEVAVHACRHFLASGSAGSPRVFLKLDYKNIFNIVRRDCLLHTVKEHFSSLYPLVWQTYSLPSNLFLGDSIISSTTGVQQGDLLGPALFSLAIHPLIHNLSSVFNVWYLDDGTLSGSLQSITEDLEHILHKTPQLGLNLNLSKCKLYVSGAVPSFASGVINQLHLLASSIRLLDPSDVMLLESPLTGSL